MAEKEEYIKELQNNYKRVKKKEWEQLFRQLEEKEIDWQSISFQSMGYDVDIDMINAFIYQEYGIEIKTATESANETANKSATKTAKYNNDMGFWKETLPHIKSVAIIGETGTGKTALAYRILGCYRKWLPQKKIYVFKHPRPELIKKLGYEILYNLNQIDKLQDCVIFLDEIHLYLKHYSGTANTNLNDLISLSRQRGITLIMSTSVSQFFVRALEGQIDVYVLKDCDADLIKQGSRMKKIIKDNCLFGTEGFKLEKNEYLYYCRKFYNLQGKYTYELPKFWNEEYSKPYKETK